MLSVVFLLWLLINTVIGRGTNEVFDNNLKLFREYKQSRDALLPGELKRPVTIYFPEMHYNNMATENNFCSDYCSNFSGSVRVLTKSGQCPKQSCKTRRQRVDECTYDSECSGLKRCCKDGCGGRNCVEPNFRLTCKDIVCDRKDYACRDDGETDARCVSTMGKGGRCPAIKRNRGVCQKQKDECFYDSECPGTQRCCSNGCNRVCIEADLRIRCEDIDCKEGYECVESNVRDAECVSTVEKPGTCPKPTADTNPLIGGCHSKCSYDSQCADETKCCYNGCAKVCLHPHNGCQATKCKVGERCQEDKYGAPHCKPIPCIQDGEIVDIECNSCTCIVGFLLCSQEDCPPVKPGFCPKITKGYRGKCVEDCSGDYACKGEMKCCSTGCGHTCQSPQKAIVHPCKTVRFRCGDSTRCAATRGLCIAGNTCPLSPLCVSNTDPYCDKCPQGKICVLQKQRCDEGHCSRMPVCIQPYSDDTIFEEDEDVEEEVVVRQQHKIKMKEYGN